MSGFPKGRALWFPSPQWHIQRQRQHDAQQDQPVADQLAAGDLFLEDQPAEHHHVQVAGGFHQAADAQVDVAQRHHVEQHAAEKQGVGQNDLPVQVEIDAGVAVIVGGLFEQDLAQGGHDGGDEIDQNAFIHDRSPRDTLRQAPIRCLSPFRG